MRIFSIVYLLFILISSILSIYSYVNKHFASNLKPALCPSSGLGMSRWGNYKSDGKKEGQIILAIAAALVLRSTFAPTSIRTICPCPSGYNAEAVLKSLQEDPSYRCLPAGELFWKTLTAPLVFPGDPDFDTQ